jgi:hypothetical protein
MPFALNSGTISASTHGTTYTEFSVKPQGEKTYSVGDNADANGDFTISEAYTVKSGLYDFLKLSGSIKPDTNRLVTQMNLLGTKQGTTSPITFNVGGMDNGEVRITAFVDGSQAMDTKTVVIGNGIPTPVPTTTSPTPTTTTVVTTTVQPTGSVTGTAVPTATPTTYSVYIEPTESNTVKSFSSADRKVSLTTTGTSYAAVMMVSQPSVPDTWLLVSKAYAVAPESLTFNPPARISFVTPGDDYAFFVARRVNSEWTPVPSTAGTGTIDAKIDRAGTYALMAYKAESTITPVPTGTAAQQTTPTPLVKETEKPKVASIAQAEPTAAPAGASKGAPVDPAIIAGALVIGVALFAVAKR